MLCEIWYRLYNFKNVKNPHWCFSRFLNCTNGTKSRNAPYTSYDTVQRMPKRFLDFTVELIASNVNDL